MTSLLEPELLRRLARLRLLARQRFLGAAGGTRRSLRRGASVELADHRPYYAGDDVRRIDWNAYARLEELVLRLHVAEEDLTLYLLVDASESLAVGAPSKLEVAKRIAAALGYVALSGSERVVVFPFDARLRAPLAPSRGRKRIGGMLRYLDAIAPAGGTDLGRAVEELCARGMRPGLVVVLSDFLDPGGWSKPIDRLISERFEPILFQVLDPSELEPPEGGDFLLVDAERGTEVEVSMDARALAAYRARLAAFFGELEAYAKRRGITYVRTTSIAEVEEGVLRALGAP